MSFFPISQDPKRKGHNNGTGRKSQSTDTTGPTLTYPM